MPQGSILGPLLFNIFINDMHMFIKECTLHNYADDNSPSCTSPMIDHVISNLQLDGNRAIKWFTDNWMQANPDKFQFMIISSDDNSTRSLTLNEHTVIVSEKHVKVLGVVIDCRLNFSLHISSVCKKAARQLNALARISNYLDVSARRMIYNVFVTRNFNYCPLVWHFWGVSNNVGWCNFVIPSLSVNIRKTGSIFHMHIWVQLKIEGVFLDLLIRNTL